LPSLDYLPVSTVCLSQLTTRLEQAFEAFEASESVALESNDLVDLFNDASVGITAAAVHVLSMDGAVCKAAIEFIATMLQVRLSMPLPSVCPQLTIEFIATVLQRGTNVGTQTAVAKYLQGVGGDNMTRAITDILQAATTDVRTGKNPEVTSLSLSLSLFALN
jgi:hypothetical protein